MDTLLSALAGHALHTPDRVLFTVREAGRTIELGAAALLEATEEWSVRLLAAGIGRGEIVFIVLEHRHELYAVYLGAMRAGLVPSFLPFPTSKQDPVLYWESHRALLARVAPGAVVAGRHNLDRIADILPGQDCALIDVDAATAVRPDATLPDLQEIETDDAVALVQHSSGTTGLKKGVALTFRQIARQVASCAEALSADRNDRVVSWLPLYHDMGLISAFLMPLTLGCRVISLGAFDWLARPDSMLRLIEQYRGTLCWLPNFALNHLVRTRDRQGSYDLSSVRAVIGCSEPCRAETFEKFDAAFEPHGLAPTALQVCYAMAEAVFAVTQTALARPPRILALDGATLAAERRVRVVGATQEGAVRFVSCGTPVAGIELRIAAARGDETGEILLRGGFVFDGYYRNPEATAAAIEDGWYRTGDVGFLHEGELFLCGRLKEMLIVHGRNYYASDIEGIASEVEGVKPGRVVAFGVGSAATASEEAVLLVETARDAPDLHAAIERSVKRAVFDRLELALNRVVLVPPGAVVKTTSGKVSRKENIDRFLAGAPVAEGRSA